jgi:histone deacetylase 1/2
MPSRVIHNSTPIELLTKHKPNYQFLRTFGCACWPNLRPYNAHKLEFRSRQCVFLGYSPLHHGYKCLDRSTGRVYLSRDVVFDELVFPFSDGPSSVINPYHEHAVLLSPTTEPDSALPTCADMIPASVTNLDSPDRSTLVHAGGIRTSASGRISGRTMHPIGS